MQCNQVVRGGISQSTVSTREAPHVCAHVVRCLRACSAPSLLQMPQQFGDAIGTPGIYHVSAPPNHATWHMTKKQQDASVTGVVQPKEIYFVFGLF